MTGQFTETDIAKEIFRYTHGHEESFSPLMEMIKRDEMLVVLPEKDLGGKTRYSYRPYFEKEQSLIDDLSSLSVTRGIAIGRYQLGDALLSSEQEKAVREIVENDKALSVLVGKAGTGKTRSLRGLADVYQSKKVDVYGMATSGIAAKELGDSIGVPSRTIASWKQEWENTPERIPSNAVLIVDEAGMVDVENMAYMARIAKEHNNTIIGVGDSLQFQAIGTGNAFSLMQEVAPTVSALSSIRRQDHAWMREASEHLSRHDIEQGVTPYAEKGHVHLLKGKERLYHEIVDRYLADERKEKLILAYSLSDVKRLNDDVREGLKRSGKLGDETRFHMQDGEIGFAVGDRILFKKNEYKELDAMQQEIDRFNSWQRDMKHVSEYLEKADTHYKESASILLESAEEIKEVITEHAKDNDVSKQITSLLDEQEFKKVQELWDSLNPKGSKLFGSQEKHVHALRMEENSLKGTVELYTYHRQDRERKSDYEKQHHELMKEKPHLDKQKAWSMKERVEAKKKEVQQLLHTLKEKDLSDTMKQKLSQQGISKEQDGGLHLGR